MTCKQRVFIKLLLTLSKTPSLGCLAQARPLGDKGDVTSKLKEKLWGDKELEGKGELRYYKEVINYNLENIKIPLYLD